MKQIGIVRKIDHLGRIVIPIELRRSLSLDDSGAVEILSDGERIILQRQQSNCVFCGSDNVVATLHGRYVCKECADALDAQRQPGDIKSDAI